MGSKGARGKLNCGVAEETEGGSKGANDERGKGKIELRLCVSARKNNLEQLKLYINECHYLKQPI